MLCFKILCSTDLCLITAIRRYQFIPRDLVNVEKKDTLTPPDCLFQQPIFFKLLTSFWETLGKKHKMKIKNLFLNTFFSTWTGSLNQRSNRLGRSKAKALMWLSLSDRGRLNNWGWRYGFHFKECGEILVDSVVEIFCKIYYLLTFQFSVGDILRGYIHPIISNKNTTIAAWIYQNLKRNLKENPRDIKKIHWPFLWKAINPYIIIYDKRNQKVCWFFKFVVYWSLTTFCNFGPKQILDTKKY